MRPSILILLPLFGFTGCASTQLEKTLSVRESEVVDTEPAPTTDSTEPVAMPATVAADPQAEPQDPVPAVASRARRASDAAMREVFRDPKYQRQFAASYLSKTDVEPGVTVEERDTMIEVIALIQDEKLDEAKAIVDDNLDADTSAVFDFTLGNIHYQRDELDLAGAAFERAAQKYPNFLRAWTHLGQIRFQQERYDDAVDAFGEMVRLGGADALSLGLLGVSHVRMSNPIAAESAFRRAMMLDGDRLEWKVGLAESFFQQGLFANAAALFDTLIRENPNEPKFWLAQGEAYARLGRHDDAAHNFEVVDGLGASTSDSLNNLGDIYSMRGVYDLAVSAYLRAVEQNPERSPDRAIRAARFLVQNGALDEARSLVEGLERVRGDQLSVEDRKDIYKVHVRLAAVEGASEAEAAALAEIVKLDPLDGDALIMLGRYYARQNDPVLAKSHFEQAADLPDYEADAKLRHGEMLVRRGEYAKALPLLEASNKIKPRAFVQKFIQDVRKISVRTGK